MTRNILQVYTRYTIMFHQNIHFDHITEFRVFLTILNYSVCLNICNFMQT